MKAVILSDSHFHYWQQHNVDNKRLKSQLDSFEKVVKFAWSKGVPILYGGDLFHNPSEISNKLLSYVVSRLRYLFNNYPVLIYAISGNHDMSEKNTLTHRSPSFISSLSSVFDNFHCVDFTQFSIEDMDIYAIPYLTLNVGFMDHIKTLKPRPSRLNILLCHTSFNGQQDTNGVVVGTGENIDETKLEDFDLILAGHTHKKGHVRNNIYSIGAQQELRLSDMGGRFGFWVIEDDNSLRFKEIEGTPKFRLYTEDSEKDNDFDYWVKEPKPAEIVGSISASVKPGDRHALVEDYFKAMGYKSKAKRKLTLRLINEVV